MTISAEAGEVLDRIISEKRRQVASWGATEQSAIRPSSRDLCHFIATHKQEIAVIAEIKKATPFRGRLVAENFDILRQAQTYEDIGAAAISVLTDEQFFQGSFEDLERISNQSALPVLCKDFVIDPRQIYRARAHGADAILLIVGVLSDRELLHFLDVCNHIHMRALVEVHNEAELDRALKAGARVIGINNRDLKTGDTNLEITLRLVKNIPKELVVVSESGINGPDDIRKLQGLVDAVLVGATLMTAANPAHTLADLVTAGSNP